MKLNKLTPILGIVAMTFAASTAAHAQLFDYQYSTSGNPSQSGAAILGTSNDPAWNNLSSTTFTDTTGTDTFTITYSNPFNQNYPYNFGGNSSPNPDADPGTGALFAANLYNPGELVFTIGGLAASQAYTLVLYAGGTGLTPANYTVTGTGTFNGFNNGNSVSLADGEGVAYAQIDVVSSSTGTLGIDELNAGGNGYVVLNGFQLGAVPEPSTYALFAVGGIILLVIRNRRKTQSLV